MLRKMNDDDQLEVYNTDHQSSPIFQEHLSTWIAYISRESP